MASSLLINRIGELVTNAPGAAGDRTMRTPDPAGLP